MATGQMGISPPDFFCMTPAEFYHMQKHWLKLQDMRLRESWEQTRALALYILTPHTKKRLNPKSIMRLPWDKLSKQYIEQEKQQRENDAALERMREMMEKQGIKIDLHGEA